ncbi:MAG: sugar phosphate isomerase/epimerase family protein [Syntrophobacteraceae bacterium]
MSRIDNMLMAGLSDEILGLLRRVHVNMPWTYLPEYLELVLELGMNVEIGFAAEALDAATHSDLASTSALLHRAGCGLSLHGPFWDLNPGSIDPLVRQATRFRLQQFFECAEILQPARVVCHTGYDPRHHQGHKQQSLENSLEFWEPLVKKAESYKIPLQIENVWESDPEYHKELLGKINSPYFRFCLDVGHQHAFSETPLALWLEELTEFLGEIHLHDNDGARDSHLPVGEGNIDFTLLFEVLEAKKSSPLLTLEPHRPEDLPKTLQGLVQVIPAGKA